MHSGDNRESFVARICVKLKNRKRETAMGEESSVVVSLGMRVAEDNSDCSECRPCHWPVLLEVHRHSGTMFTMRSQSYHVRHVRRASLYVQMACCTLQAL